MPYRYRCEQCRATSPPAPNWAAAVAEQDRHRTRFHGGHIPDGEQITRTEAPPRNWRPALILFGGGALAAIWQWIHRHL